MRGAVGRRVAIGLAAGALGFPGAALAAPGKLVEKRVDSLAADAKKVEQTYVRVRAPLPASVGPHPPACDWVSYLRFRNPDGPGAPRKADAVYVIIPGFIGGAATFDQVARHTVEEAARRGKDVEFWALERRSNCLEDHAGIEAARAAEDATRAYDYYWGGLSVDGRSFPGFVSHEDAEWLDHVGLGQTMRDWQTVLRTGMPGQRRRQRKVICGGHSLGGPLTAAFAGWDFDGDPATRRDAGYKQCAAFVGFDTRLRIDTSGGGLALSPAGVLFAGLTASGSPYVDTPPLTPETLQLPPIFGAGAFFDPQATDMLAELPRTTNIDLSIRLLYSRDAVHFATQEPSIRDFTISNETVMSGVFDDNSQPLSFVRASLGETKGGPLVDKRFPAPDPTLALPEEPSTPLYSWRNYDDVAKNGRPLVLNDEGEPYTSRESEVTDVTQFARGLFDAPADFIEQYFPTRILEDFQDVGEGERSGELENFRYDGIAKRPALVINAGDSDTNESPDRGRPERDEAPNDRRPSKTIVIPGYNHLDVTAAARRQNDGRPEPSARALTRFGLDSVR